MSGYAWYVVATTAAVIAAGLLIGHLVGESGLPPWAGACLLAVVVVLAILANMFHLPGDGPGR